ncbi:MAG: glycoside hydrolase family 38 C-terminal domain-containing protein [Bacteroidales bacterium]|nr:glycoside hydrolase family 38 C-terminal domain-containing protein [Bacteroidales bacterium]
MKARMLSLILLVALCAAQAQPTDSSPTNIVNGYQQTLSGTDFWYHSSIQSVKESLLIRATDGNSAMQWETAATPDSIANPFTTFVWLAGIGSSPGKASFSLAVDGKELFTFWADGNPGWTLRNDDGSTLRFKNDFTDQHGDQFGFMFLTLPTKKLSPGKPLQIKVTGGKFSKTSWYMTFKFPIINGITFKALPAIPRHANNQPTQLGVAGIMYFGEPARAHVYVAEKLVVDTPVRFGYNHVRVPLPATKTTTTVPYRLVINHQEWTGTLNMAPVRPWRVNFVQHSHTDIGYTRSQTDILAEHLRYIDYALDYCDLTDDYPDEARFRWTCEASWAVDEYLNCRPAAQIKRLLKRIQEKRIEITGMYFNFDELPGELTLAASLKPVKRFRELGIDVKTAMQNDVNGIGWSLCDHFPDLGIKYLNMGTHGHRALICFDKPTLFWWESPSGKRMLAFRAEHYMIGNTVFKIHGDDFNVFEEELLTYLERLQSKGYEYDLISIQHSGYITDNSPPSTLACEMIRQWNQKYEWPKLKTASATEFFEEMEAKHGDSFQVIRGAWPDWWTDGFGASAREVAATRVAESDLAANTAGLVMAAMQDPTLPSAIDNRIEAIQSALLFYTEHTVGYHASVREPFHKYTMEQRAIKESYAWEASRRAKMAGEETMGLLQSFVNREKLPSIVIFNTLNWNRGGLCKIYIDHQIIPRDAPFSIVDESGKEAPAQPVERHSDGTFWAVWVDDIPAFGYKKYAIKPTAQPDKQPVTITHVMENGWYKVVVDEKRGAISSLTDKELNLELTDKASHWKLGEFIYERLENREQMEQFKLDNFTREPLDSVWVESTATGKVWNTIRFKGTTRAANPGATYEFEIRLFNTTKRIDLAYSIEKKLVTDPEAIYIAFPLKLENGQLAFDVQGGEVRAGIDQIPGSANDWNTVQNYARLSGPAGQIMISSPEIPLMQFGAINTGRYKAGALPASTHLFGWPMNNYWTTNFNADQHGGHSWVYSITSQKHNSTNEAARFGMGNRTPFLTRVLPGGGTGDKTWQQSLITGWPENIVLISATPENDGLSAILHVRETAGLSVQLSLTNQLTGKKLSCIEVDANGVELSKQNTQLKPFESAFFRVKLQ